MNAKVIDLDSQFNLSPPATQTAWNDAAGAYAGIAVCGCARDNINGQKLYRLVNFANAILGNPTAADPPTMDPDYNYLYTFVAFFHDFGIAHENAIIVEIGLSCPSALSIFQNSLGLQNPYAIQEPDGSSALYYETDPEFAGLWALQDSLEIGVCLWDKNQCPRGTDTATLMVIN